MYGIIAFGVIIVLYGYLVLYLNRSADKNYSNMRCPNEEPTVPGLKMSLKRAKRKKT